MKLRAQPVPQSIWLFCTVSLLVEDSNPGDVPIGQLVIITVNLLVHKCYDVTMVLFKTMENNQINPLSKSVYVEIDFGICI